MNVVIISPEYPPETNWGGVATFNYNLSQIIKRLGHQVYVLTAGPHWLQGTTQTIDGVRVIYIQYKFANKFINQLYYRFPFNIVRLVGKKWLPLTSFSLKWNLYAWYAFTQLHKKQRIDLIHTPDYHFPALLLSFLYRNVPLIVNVQGSQHLLSKFEKRSADRLLKGYLETFYVKKQAQLILACSQFTKKETLSYISEIRNKLIDIPNFLNHTIYLNKNQSNINNVVYWGRLEYRKGVDILLSTFCKLAINNQQLKLYLIGESGEHFPYKSSTISFSQLYSNYKINDSIRKRIFIFPRIDDKLTLIELLQKIKGIAIFPSRYEPFGYVTIEAMALGYITIASANGGGKEIIRDGINGFLAMSETSSLLKILNKIFKMRKKQTSLIAINAVKTVVSKYSYESIMSVYKNLYKNINR